MTTHTRDEPADALACPGWQDATTISTLGRDFVEWGQFLASESDLTGAQSLGPPMTQRRWPASSSGEPARQGRNLKQRWRGMYVFADFSASSSSRPSAPGPDFTTAAHSVRSALESLDPRASDERIDQVLAQLVADESAGHIGASTVLDVLRGIGPGAQRVAAVRLLGLVACEGEYAMCVEEARSALQSRDPRVRYAAVDLLVDLNTTESVELLRSIARSDESAAVKANAADGLAHLRAPGG